MEEQSFWKLKKQKLQYLGITLLCVNWLFWQQEWISEFPINMSRNSEKSSENIVSASSCMNLLLKCKNLCVVFTV